MQDELLQFKLQKVWILVDLPNGERAISTKWVYRNKKDERGIVIKNKARLVAQGYTQEEWIDSLMYLTSSRPDIMFADSPFDLVAYTDSDYARASLDRKSITGGCQFLGCRLISWQCKKQTVTKIHIDNESTIFIVKNPVFHSKTKHIEIRHHFIRDSNEKKLIQMIKIHIDLNVADLLTKAFDGRLIVLICSGLYTNDDWKGMQKLLRMEIGLYLLLPVLVNDVRHKLTTAG
ncbi:putative ribonuclease H-like domain-containing protein [Tanacetum coccineum]